VSSALIDKGVAALRAGDVEAAREAFELALAESESGAALEGLAEALYQQRDYAAAVAHFERAYTAHRRSGDKMAAGRAARTLGWIGGYVRGNWAVRSGWFARARTIFSDAGQDGPERGWVLLVDSYAEPDSAVREDLLHQALAIGRRFSDPDIEFEALVCLGCLLIMTGRVEEGLSFCDESLAAACAGELTDLATVEAIFCRFFWMCELVNDVPRADQWMSAAAALLRRRNVVGAFCRAHYGGILTAAGRWEEAEAELVESARCFDRGLPERRSDALVRLADLRLRQGDLDQAAVLLKGLDTHPDAVRSLAALHLARGETAQARNLLECGTSGSDGDLPAGGETSPLGPLLALLVDVHLADGRLDDAGHVAERLERLAQRQRGPYLTAAAALAKGRVCLARGHPDARVNLHSALQAFTLARLPMELAETRLEMARALAASSPEAAIAAGKAALEDFERLKAARHADAAGALLRSLGAPIRTGPKGFGALTRRESEVLKLIGTGMSNAEIAERLYITRKTVEHHVGNVLAKLGLRNRAEAAAYVIRSEPGR
jgi:DNA-binding CsgD family transcriptional regulator/Tfp pilus assembly protein PilF